MSVTCCGRFGGRGRIDLGTRHSALGTRRAALGDWGSSSRGSSRGWVEERPWATLLFVTLDKSGQPEKHKYQDAFLSPTEVRWQSQNKTSQASESGQRLARHRELGVTIHLFVRARPKDGAKTAGFVYCGPVEFQRWEGEKPITVWWRLAAAVPEQLRAGLRVPGPGVV